MYLKMALGNIKRNALDYLVYFITLCIAVCLLYSFTASADYLASLDLTADQRAVYARIGDALRAFSVLVVIVFACLVAYANRFIIRRRKREAWHVRAARHEQCTNLGHSRHRDFHHVRRRVCDGHRLRHRPIAGVFRRCRVRVRRRVATLLDAIKRRGRLVGGNASSPWPPSPSSRPPAARRAKPLAEQMNARQEYVSRKQMTPCKAHDLLPGGSCAACNHLVCMQRNARDVRHASFADGAACAQRNVLPRKAGCAAPIERPPRTSTSGIYAAYGL